MNAVCVYVTAARLVLQTESTIQQDTNSTTFPTTTAPTTTDARLLDLKRLLPNLRQLLSCVVCCRLLNDPYAPKDGRCQHNVCRLCIRGRKILRPLCTNCKDHADYKTYDENKQMRYLLLCYKSLCEHIMNTNLCQQLNKQKIIVNNNNNTTSNNNTNSNTNNSPSLPLPQMSAQELLQEGASYNDVLSCFTTDLPINILSFKTLTTNATATATTTPTPTPMPTTITTISTITTTAAANTTTTTINSSTIAVTTTTATATTSTSTISTTASTTKTPQALFSNNNQNNQIYRTPPLLVKKELISPPLNINKTANLHNTALISISSTTTATTTTTTANNTNTTSQGITIKQLTTTTATTTANNNNNHNNNNNNNNNSVNVISSSATVLPLVTPTITYMGTPGVVVPIVSSSATTAAPLSIASAKLQSLNRQIIRARTTLGNALIPAVSSKGEVIKPLAFKLALASSVNTTINNNAANYIMTTASIATTTATVTSQQQIRNPPPIKTVSNGSAMYSVLYTGIGNKITIKRKTDGENEDFAPRKTVTATTSLLNATSASSVVFRQVSTSKLTSAALKRRGCRCGNATATPGKLTCCGQRCPCYVDAKSCIGCKCRGCRNPHRPDGGKVRPIIPELACYEIQMADDSCSLSPHELLPTATTTTTNSNNTIMENNTSLEEYVTPISTQINLKGATISTMSSIGSVTGPTSVPSSSTATATLIPFRSLQHLTTSANNTITTQQQQQQQQQTTLNTNSNILQRESVLVQNAAGKYQVLNLFTTSGPLQQNIPHHTVHTLPTLQMSTNNNNNSNNNNNINSNNNNNNQSHGNTFLLPAVSLCTSVANNNIITSTTTTSLPQIFLQQQQQQQPLSSTTQQQQTRIHCQTVVSSSSCNNNNNNINNNTLTTPPGLSLQLQQQLKQSSIITVHPINNNNLNTNNTNNNNNNVNNNVTTTNTGTTITLSPILVQPTNTYTPTDTIFTSDSTTEEYLNLNNHATSAATTSILAGGNLSNTVMTTTAMVEVIDSGEI